MVQLRFWVRLVDQDRNIGLGLREEGFGVGSRYGKLGKLEQEIRLLRLGILRDKS